MIEGSVLPTASRFVAPSARIAGVEITAPPTPNVPDRTPVKKPAMRTRTTVIPSDIVADTTGDGSRSIHEAAGEDTRYPWLRADRPPPPRPLPPAGHAL